MVRLAGMEPFVDPIRYFGIVIRDYSDFHGGEVVYYEEFEGTANEANERAEELRAGNPNLHAALESH